jgi:outer membrane protein OmpU
MNKLTKIGVSALCGSLASVSSVYAGALEVVGGATATWANNETEATGNPIGLSSGMTFTGSGELDNGTTFTLTLTNADQSAYSAGSIQLVTPGMGTITIDQGAGGTGIDRYDDMMPTAWEETTGTSVGTGLQTAGGIGSNANIDWVLPSGFFPDGMQVVAAYTPRAQGLGANDKGVAGSSNEHLGSGYDLAIEHTGLADGLKVFGGISRIEGNGALMEDAEQIILGATYAVGMVTVGYQYSMDDKNSTQATTAAYENQAFGISFAINDDLTLSYGEHSSERSVTTAVTADVENTAKSLQASYTMGGMSLKLAETSVDNGNYVSGTSKDLDGTTIALSLAF